MIRVKLFINYPFIYFSGVVKQPQTIARRHRVPEVRQKMDIEEEIIRMWRENKDNGFVSKSPGMGRGLFSSKNIPPHTLVGEYQGKQCSGAKARSFSNNSPSNYALFWVDDGRMFMRDAEKSRCKLRFMNHSKTDYNCKIVKIKIDGIYRPLMVTTKLIKMGEELLWDYNDPKLPF